MAIAALTLPLQLTAQVGSTGSRASMLVTPAWLAQHLKDPNLVLLHVGDPKDYPAKHIPGARLISLGDIATREHKEHVKMLEMLPPDSLRHVLQHFGISDDSRIVVYYGGDWVSPSTRVVFTLDWAGLGARTALLDGGMAAWAKEGHPVTDAVPPAATPGKLSAVTTRPTIVTADWVRDHLRSPGYRVIDARNGQFYDGLESGAMNGGGRLGHIAGAGSVPYDAVFDDKNALRSPAELQALFAKAGVKSGDTIVGYCHIGQQATAMLFAARSLGIPVLLYDGSFTEWEDLGDAYPVENPNAKKKS
jgi:thiosulfate/3-mercaptopyruvate sulfurtransferase